MSLTLSTEWDKIFPQSEKVNHRKVTFPNRYGITLAADVYEPKDAKGKLCALALSGPFGAVKEQASGFYAQTLAERGFFTLAFDPSFTGESGGTPRRMASPDINTEDFMAAVDFLSVQDNVDANRIGIIGICGFGGFAINAAALDTRIKATIAVTMYDMTRVTAKGYNDTTDEKARYEQKVKLCEQRTADFKSGTYPRVGGVPKDLPEEAPQFLKDYSNYYQTKRGYHPRAGGCTDGWAITGCQSFYNQPILCWSAEIHSPLLLIHGEKAHSRYFSEDAFKAMTKDSPYAGNKELMIIPGASHTDLYDGGKDKVIPWDKIVDFFTKNLQ